MLIQDQTTNRRPWLLGGTILAAALGLSGAALAQDIQSGPEASETDQEEIIEDNDTQAEDPAAAPQDTIVVTGSRIRRPDYEFSNPVVSVSGENLAYSGVTNVTDFATDFPALANSFTSEDSADTGNNAGIVGLNLLNLRNLGTDRTLVLVDGRRHVAANEGSAAVDTNTIPVALIEDIQVLTGGASAVYGADGVSGVVNFVLKDDFEGIDTRFQTGTTDEGGGSRTFGSILAGENFNNGRTNVTLAYEFGRDEALRPSDRDYATIGNRVVLTGNPGDLGDDPDLPDNIFLRNIRYPDTSLGGSVTTDFDFSDDGLGFGIDFNGDGTPWEGGVATPDFTVVGGDGSLLDVFVDELLPELDRNLFHATARHDLTPDHTIFANAKFAQTHTAFRAQPTFDFGEGPFTFLGLFVPIDNPFIPENVRQDALQPGNTGDLGGVFVLRDNLDLGYTGRDINRETFRSVVGAEGTIFGDVFYELSYVYGQTKSDIKFLNDRINERWFAAIDAVRDPATGEIVCRSDLDPTAVPTDFINAGGDPEDFGTTFTPGPNSGCVPADIFGEDVSREAANWINQTTLTRNELTQNVVSGYLSGDSSRLFELPGGSVGWVLGAEYREEESRNFASPLQKLGAEEGYDILWSGTGADSSGRFDVAEVFAELEAPLLADMPFAQELTIDAAYRYSEYSTVGETDTWKIGGVWRPVDQILFRATEAKSVRAPNIGELFLPQVQTFALIDDPCDKDNVNAGTSFRQDNCAAALTALGFDPATFDYTGSASIEGLVGGNPDLGPEEARTTTYGVVVEPSFVPGLTASIDYYEIELTEAIQFFTAQTIIDKCYDLPQPNEFCGLISRSPGNGFVDFFQQSAVNVASYNTSGYDFTVRYQIDPADFGVERDIGTFQLSLVGSKLEDLTFIELEDAEPDDDVGEPGAPEWQAVFDLTWNYDSWTVNYGVNYFSETERVSEERRAADPDWVPAGYFDYSERLTHDIQVRKFFNDEQFALYGGVNNMFNQEPDRGSLTEPVSPLGRFFYIGATARFGGLPFLN